jgi:tRNA-splicing ligase RtcB (3'-phosphate/5'-hydroxy nucleic acid ligase)
MPTTRIFGEHDARTIAQLERCASVGSATGAVLCADGHLGYAQPVGGVVAYAEHVSISGVGFDIACGNMAARLDVKKAAIAERIGPIVDDIARAISFGVGRKNAERVEHPLLDDAEAWRAAGVGELKELGAAQLGTVGSGNHYVDLFEDEEGFVWIGNHFGSRGLGHKSAMKYLKLAGGKDGMDVEPALVHQDDELGRRYLAAMTLAGRYAYAGREWVIERVRAIIGATITDVVHNHHNFAWRERHGGRDVWVVRKGATPAFPGQRGFVGATMGEPAVIIEGVEGTTSRDALYSTIHGAGRVLSRTQAAGKSATVWECTDRDCSHFELKQDYVTKRQAAGIEEHGRFTTCPAHPQGRMRKRFRRVVGGLVDYQAVRARLVAQGIVIRGGGADEAPEAYKRLDEVLAHHAGTMRILHTLKPFAVLMAGEGEYDPYKD